MDRGRGEDDAGALIRGRSWCKTGRWEELRIVGNGCHDRGLSRNPDCARGNYFFRRAAQKRKVVPMIDHALIRSALLSGIRLTRENATADMRAVLPMTDALERELPQMLREHEVIRAAVTGFRAEATKAGRDEYVRFSDELGAHARLEEEILYPAAVLVGRHVQRTAPRR